MVEIPCICPPKDGQPRHEHDTVTLREKLDFKAAVTARNTVAFIVRGDDDASVAEITAALTEVYLLEGISAWSVVDSFGKPVPVTKPAIREHLLSDPDVAMVVGDAADEAYSEAVMRPLMARAQTSSPPMPTDESTSATNGSPTEAPTPSWPSSTTTIPTDDTETTSSLLVGASSSSQNSK